jgi:hypothetical protein
VTRVEEQGRELKGFIRAESTNQTPTRAGLDSLSVAWLRRTRLTESTESVSHSASFGLGGGASGRGRTTHAVGRRGVEENTEG